MELDSRDPRDAPDAHRIDPVAVERLLRGREPVGRPLSRAEVCEAIRRKDAYDLGGKELAVRLGVSASNYARLRDESEDS